MSSTPAPGAVDDGADAAFVVRTPGRRVEVRGSDRLDYLEDVTTQSLGEASAGQLHRALYLDPHGAPLAVFDIAVLAESVALLAPDAEVASTLVDVLGARTFLLDARFQATDDVVIALRGGGAEPIAAAVNLGARAGTVRPAGDQRFVVGRDHGAVDLVGPASAVDDAVAALLDAGAREGDDADLERWRVRTGQPAWGREIASPHLPEEYGLLASHVHLAKGCYPGQEAVARMWMLGRPRRRLVRGEIVSGPVEAGWSTGTGRRAATVTSVAPGGTEVLAFVAPDVEPDTVLRADDGSAVRVVGAAGAQGPPPGHDPQVSRRRDRPRAARS